MKRSAAFCLLFSILFCNCSTPVATVYPDDNAATPQDVGSEEQRELTMETAVELDWEQHDTQQPVPTAELSVQLQYSGPVPLDTVSVWLLPAAAVDCSAISGASIPEELAIASAVTIDEAAWVIFQSVNTLAKYTLVAVGTREGSPAAFGCAGPVVLPVEGGVKSVNLPLKLLLFSMADQYQMLTKIDMAPVFPGLGQPVLSQLAELSQGYPVALTESLPAAVVESVPCGTSGCDVLHELLAGALEQCLTAQYAGLPPEFHDLGQMLLQQLPAVTARSDWVVAPADTPGTYLCQQQWVELSMEWPPLCPPGVPEADCGGAVFDPQQALYSGEFVFAPESSAVCSAANLDQLVLQSHEVHLNPALLFLLALDELVVSQATKHEDLAGYLATFELGCAGLSECLQEKTEALLAPYGGLGLDAMTQICIQSTQEILEPVTAEVVQLDAQAQIRWSGSGVLIDDDDDLMADRIVQGALAGHFEMSGVEGDAVSGTFKSISTTD